MIAQNTPQSNACQGHIEMNIYAQRYDGGMHPSIWHARFKVEWAKKHLASIEVLLRALEKTGGNRITAYDDIANGLYIISTEHFSETEGFRIALTIADFVSSLRSSLDHLAWQLALLTLPKPSTKLMFPIFEKNTVDAQVRMAEVTFGIPEEAITIMKSMQPYHSGDAYKTTPLWRLNKIWNIDKHRHLFGFEELPDTWEFHIEGVSAGMENIPIDHEQIGNHTIVRLPLVLKNKCISTQMLKLSFESMSQVKAL